MVSLWKNIGWSISRSICLRNVVTLLASRHLMIWTKHLDFGHLFCLCITNMLFPVCLPINLLIEIDILFLFPQWTSGMTWSTTLSTTTSDSWSQWRGLWAHYDITRDTVPRSNRSSAPSSGSETCMEILTGCSATTQIFPQSTHQSVALSWAFDAWNGACPRQSSLTRLCHWWSKCFLKERV